MGSRVRTAVACILVAVLALSVTACASVAEKATRGAVEKATGVKVDDKGGSVTVTGKDGQTATFSGGEKKLPEGLPADLPVYAAEPDSSAKAETPDGTTFTFTMSTADDVATILAWYKSAFEGKGWKVENSTSADVDGKTSGSISAKKDKMEAVVTMSPASEGGKNEIAVVLAVKK